MRRNGRDSKQLHKSKKTNIATKSSKNIGPKYTDAKISKTFPIKPTNQLMLFQEDSLARISLSQISLANKESKGREVDYGRNINVVFAKYDRDMQLWKTFQQYLTMDWELYSETWPISGMMRNGIVYQHGNSELRKLVSGRLLWPTPCASDWIRLQFSVEQVISAKKQCSR